MLEYSVAAAASTSTSTLPNSLSHARAGLDGPERGAVGDLLAQCCSLAVPSAEEGVRPGAG